MGNMSYCRFENTYRDLEACYEVLYTKRLRELSESEQKYAKKLIELANDIATDFIYLLEE